MQAFVLTIVFVFYGTGGQPTAATTLRSEHDSAQTCEVAKHRITKNLKDGAVVSAECNER